MSGMDFSEYFADIEGKYKPQNLQQMTDRVKGQFKGIQADTARQKEKKEL